MKRTLRILWKKVIPAMLSFVVCLQLVLTNFTVRTSADDKFEASKRLIEPYVNELKKLHPNWNFTYYNTGLDWNEVIREESTLRRNLVPDSPHTMMVKGVDSKWHLTPTSWKSTDIEGAFNWDSNKWVELSGGGWIQASDAAIRYIIDPRNWISEANIFSFEQLSYNSAVQTKEVLIKMMDNSYMDCDYARVGGTNNLTYADVLIEAGQKYNVSPVYLCSKLIYEKGRGKYNSATGRYEMDDVLGSGVTAPNGVVYYNMFNIQAAGSTIEQVIQNGLNEAISNNWTSQYAAIMGGSEKIAKKYIAFGQTTLYFQKFAVSVAPEYRYWKQYQQAITAAVNEGYNNMEAYKNMNMLSSAFSFVIPVYYNMPAAVSPKPSPDGSTANPNYKLKSLSVKGTDIFNQTTNLVLTPSFNKDVTNYNISVPYTTNKLTVSASPIASTSKVTGTGTVDLKVGNNAIKVVCTSEYGTSRTYTINVNRASGSTLIEKLSDDTQTIKANIEKTKTSYSLSFTNDRKIVQLLCQPENPNAKMVITGDFVIEDEEEEETTSASEENTTSSEQGEGETTTEKETIPNLVVENDGTMHAVGTKSFYLESGKNYGVTPKLFLKEGSNKITIDIYPADDDVSSKTSYSIELIRFTDTKYTIDQNVNDKETFLCNFNVETSVSSTLSKFNVNNGKAVVTDKDGKEKKAGDLLGTGDTIKIYDANNKLMWSRNVIIFGDVTGDGKIDIYDFGYIRKMIIKKTGLSGIYLLAADTYPDSKGIDIYDFGIVRRYLIKKTPVSQSR